MFPKFTFSVLVWFFAAHPYWCVDVDETGGDWETGIGSKVPTSEKGYQLVVESKSDEEMKTFIRRTLEKEARFVEDEAGLSGMVPYYSGSVSAQSMEALKKELRDAKWVGNGLGRTEPLDETGYQNTAKLGSKSHMLAFMRRILDRAGKKCTNEGALAGLVPHYNGDVAIQSFDNLQRELLVAPWTESRNKARVEELQASSIVGAMQKANLETTNSEEVHSETAKREEVHAETAKSEELQNATMKMDTDVVPDETEAIQAMAGGIAPVSESGYQSVANMKSDEEMQVFIRRTVESEARVVQADSGLVALTPWFSGTRAVQDLESLKLEIRNASWVSPGVGRTAPLDETGYQTVAKMAHKAHMAAFARRILDSEHLAAADEGAFLGLLPFYDGEISTQSFDKLKHEVLSANWTTPREPVSDWQVCADWCVGELFIKAEPESTLMMDMSSWDMKCGWPDCSGCTACGMSAQERTALRRETTVKHNTCDDWCGSEVLETVGSNKVSTRQLSWNLKCGLQQCAACSACDESSFVGGRKEVIDVAEWIGHHHL